MKKKASAEKAEDILRIKGGSVRPSDGVVSPPPRPRGKNSFSNKESEKPLHIWGGSVRPSEGIIPPPPPRSKVAAVARQMRERREP